jgi:hypothetical protein
MYLTLNKHLAVIECKQCYFGSELLNIVNDLTLAHMGSISIQ